MAKREFLQKAHKYNSMKHGIGGLWSSKKLDGHRAFWDGGVSRGIPKSEVPWANTAKDYRYKRIQIATGLWTQNGNVYHAPNWWLNSLPKLPLDGELWSPNHRRQDIATIIKPLYPGSLWKEIKLHCYDSPPLAAIFSDGHINSQHFETILQIDIIEDFIKSRDYFNQYLWMRSETDTFRTTYHYLKKYQEEYSSMVAHPQYQLYYNTTLAEKQIKEQLLNLDELVMDGLIVRHPDKLWVPEKTYNVLKVKPWDDSEGIVIGYITGRETDKGSRLLGMMGAAIIKWNNKIFEISGFYDKERTLYAYDPDNAANHCKIAKDWAINHPEEKCPEWIQAMNFPRGSVITFKYRGVSKDGIPQEARYWRKR